MKQKEKNDIKYTINSLQYYIDLKEVGTKNNKKILKLGNQFIKDKK